MPNLATILIGLVILAVFAAIVVRGVHNLRRGRHSCACGGGCGGCDGRCGCHSSK